MEKEGDEHKEDMKMRCQEPTMFLRQKEMKARKLWETHVSPLALRQRRMGDGISTARLR